jgi:hypothetical protein
VTLHIKSTFPLTSRTPFVEARASEKFNAGEGFFSPNKQFEACYEYVKSEGEGEREL